MSQISDNNGFNHEKLDDLIFGDLTMKWSRTINSIAELLDIPVAIIFKREGDKLRIFVTNENDKNPFKKDDKIPIQGSKFKTHDYREIDLDINNVATQADFISYLGYPLTWPNGEYFGTVCVLDDTTNYFSGNIEMFLDDFCELLNDSLKLIDINLHQNRLIEDLQQKHDQTSSLVENVMCRNCKQVLYKDQWIDLNTFLTEHPEELIRSISFEASVHTCN